jgi:hypothetical protein
METSTAVIPTIPRPISGGTVIRHLVRRLLVTVPMIPLRTKDEPTQFGLMVAGVICALIGWIGYAESRIWGFPLLAFGVWASVPLVIRMGCYAIPVFCSEIRDLCSQEFQKVRKELEESHEK